MKKTLCLLLALIFAFTMPLGAFALDGPNQADITIDPVSDTEIDEDTAAVIALLFVLSNLDETRWDMTTNISSIIPMYDNNEQVVAYCVSLFTESGDAGYIIVSADVNTPLVQEFSDSAPALIDAEDAEAETVYYYGPMAYGTEKDETAVYAYENCTASTTEQTGGLIASIKAMGELASTNDYITNPLTYLRGLFPNAAFSLFASRSISGTVEGHVMEEDQACVVYATATVLQYHSGRPFSEILQICLDVAIEGGYAESEDDYEISNLVVADYVTACRSRCGLYDLSVTYALTSGTAAMSEIRSNRPVILGIAASAQYENHAVVATSYVQYDVDSPAQIRTFFGVKDGYTSETRYVDVNTIVGLYYIRIA